MITNKRTTVVIPNYNGIRYLHDCLHSLRAQTAADFDVLVVDNGSEDGSAELAAEEFPEIHFLMLGENTGFTGAVNAGIRAAEDSKYILLLNNDTIAGKHFVEELEKAMDEDENLFSCQASMRTMSDPSKMDDAGDFYTVLGWAFARGKGKDAKRYKKSGPVFFSCAGAAIYRSSMLRELGGFDPQMFAYLEDCDIGWRARLKGYENRFVPAAYVLHAGSGASGSRYNEFKVKYSSRNSVYIIRKNMPAAQRLLNLPFLLAGFAVKAVFFTAKGLGKVYLKGLWEGLRMKTESAKAEPGSVKSVQKWMLRGTLLRIREAIF